MNFTEQKNYIIAVFVSLIIHFSMIYLPGIQAPEKPALNTFPVSLMEIPSGNEIRQISVVLNPSGKEQSHKGRTEMRSSEKEEVAASDTLVKKPENQSTSKEETKIESPEKSVQAPSNTAVLPKKEEIAPFEAHAKQSENQGASDTDTKGITGPGNSSTGEPRSFGTGEAMVKIVGPMPTYPPAALKEGKEGEVAVRILVNADGRLDLVIVTKSSGDVRLDYAATSSVERKWKFTSINEGYYIDLVFSFDIHIGTSVKFLASKTRS